MNPRNPFAFLGDAWNQKHLILQFTKRKISSRYRNSVLGMLWVILTPLLMLSIYTFVFSVIFRSRWGIEAGGQGEFALFLYSGLIFYLVFAESVNESPDSLMAHSVYIKQHVFPSEVLAWVTLLSSLFGFAINTIILMIFYFLLEGFPPATVLFLPLMIIPVALWTLGMVWIVSSIGIYIRDIGQIVGPGTTALLFLSPIFYPSSRVPEGFKSFYDLNPLVFVLEAAKTALFFDHGPNWTSLAISIVIAWTAAWLGYNWFMKAKKGFADVL